MPISGNDIKHLRTEARIWLTEMGQSVGRDRSQLCRQENGANSRNNPTGFSDELAKECLVAAVQHSELRAEHVRRIVKELAGKLPAEMFREVIARIG